MFSSTVSLTIYRFTRTTRCCPILHQFFFLRRIDGSFVNLCTSPLYPYHNTHTHIQSHTLERTGTMFCSCVHT